MICCWGLLAYIKAADTRQNAGLAVRLPSRKAARAEERPRRTAKPAAPIADSPDLPEPTRVHSDRRTPPEIEDPLRSVFDEAGGSGAEDADIDSLIRRTVDDAAPSGMTPSALICRTTRMNTARRGQLAGLFHLGGG